MALEIKSESVVEKLVEALKPFLDETIIDDKLLEEMKEQALIMEKQGKIQFALQVQLESIATQKSVVTIIEEMSNL
jgi:hypothetical protein